MDRNTFDRMCKLARIELDESERQEFEPKFDKLLGFVDLLQNYQPNSSGQPMTLVESLGLRPDTPVNFEWPEGFSHEYKVSKIIDFEGGD